MTEDKLDEAVRLLHDLRVQVEGISTRLAEHRNQQDERTRQRDLSQAAIVTEAGNLRDRVTALERWRYAVAGASMAGGGIIGAVAGKLAGVV